MTSSEKAPSILGLIFTGGEGPQPQHIAAIAEDARIAGGGAPLIAAADSGLLLAQGSGAEADWIVGDMDSLGENAKSGLNSLDAFPPEKIIRHPHDKDLTDTELAFSLLREKGCGKIWIIGGGGGRLDHLLGIRSLFERDDPPERWITAAEDIRCIGESISAALIVSHNTLLCPVSVFPLGGGPWEAESSGLKWPLSGLPWTRDFIAISNVAPDGNFTIKAKQGRFLVMWPLWHQ